MNRTGDPVGFSLLIVDDDTRMLSELRRIFKGDGYSIHSTVSGEEALSILAKVRVDAALIDLKMPGMDGLTLLRELREKYPSIMVIMLTGYGRVEDAVAAMKLGAVDFLEKPFIEEALRPRVVQLYRIWELKRENEELRRKLQSHFGYDHFVGTSTVILRLKEMITQVGPTDVSVLIEGETGTGKELVARSIHHHSTRAEKPFVPVDCASITGSLIESELFGHIKGAFTGAHVSTSGLIRSADGGTLFLDEIGELSQPFQIRLLRVIQEKEVRPVGSNKTYPVDVRIVAATRRNLAQEVAAETFREDLFYRLNVVSLKVPPLRDRKEDIPLLVKYFLKRFHSNLSPIRDVSQEALQYLENYEWPGNVRELENVIRRAVALGRSRFILPGDLPERICPHQFAPSGEQFSGSTLADFEIAAITNALRRNGGNRKRAAQTLDIGEATLYRKMKKYNIKV